MISLLNPQPNERIDLTDFRYLSQSSILGALRAVPSALLTSPTKQPLWVIRGFVMSNPSGQVLSVAKGSALLSLRQGGQVLTGIVTDDGQATQSVDLSSYAAGTYGVFMRFVLTQEAYDTRAFFRASGGGEEYGQSVPTRLNGNWEVNVLHKTPGEEWLQIGTVVTPSMVLTDTRPLYFEGRVDGATASGWGSAADRSDDRSKNGLGDLQTALSALRQSLEDVKGSGIARWYTDHVAGQSIGFAGTQTQARTQWADANFYIQGDSARPRLTFAADGAHLAYTRASALLAVTGAELPTQASSTTTALALRSGANDEALLRGGFFRSGTAAGFAAVDASWSRGAPGLALGGIGFYGAQGLMGGAGVGLGYALGSAVPSLFVGASGNVGIGVGSATRLLGDTRQALQIEVATGNARGLSLTNGSQPQVVFAFHNGKPSPVNANAFVGGILDMPLGASFLVTQAGRDTASLENYKWSFGPGSLGNPSAIASVNVTTAPTVVASTVTSETLGTYSNYAQTPSLLVGNQVPSSSLAGAPLLPAQVTFQVGGQRLYNIDGGPSDFAITDIVNGQDIWRYNRTTKAIATQAPITAPVVKVTQQTGLQYSPAVTHQDTYPGNAVQVMTGTVSASSAGYSFLTVSSVGNAIRLQLPMRLMVGQQIGLISAVVTVTNTQSVQADTLVINYVPSTDTETQVGTLNRVTIAPGTNAAVGFNRNLGLQTSSPGQSLNLVFDLTSAASFRLDVKYVTINLTTPGYNPQRQ